MAPERFYQLRRLLASGMECQRVASSLLGAAEAQPHHASLHLLRGWFVAACYQARLRKEDEPNIGDFIARIDPSDVPLPSGLGEREWREELFEFKRRFYDGPPDECLDTDPFEDRIKLHCSVLEKCLAEFNRRLHISFGVRSQRERFLRAGAALLAATLAVWAGISAISWMLQPPPLWSGEYFENTELIGEPKAAKPAARIKFDWGSAPPLRGFAGPVFSARWESCLLLKENIPVVFTLGADDGGRLLVDGRRIIDIWGAHAYFEESKTVILEPGVHRVTVEYNNFGGASRLNLRAFPEGRDEDLLSEGNLRLPPCNSVEQRAG